MAWLNLLHGMDGAVNWYAIALFIAIIGVAGYYASKTEKLKKINFLNYAPLKSLLKSRWYPLIFVLPTMIIFAILVIKLFFGSPEASSNFGSIMMWILLWPILPVLFLLFGRLWCSVCPLSRVSDEVQKKWACIGKCQNSLRSMVSGSLYSHFLS